MSFLTEVTGVSQALGAMGTTQDQDTLIKMANENGITPNDIAMGHNLTSEDADLWTNENVEMVTTGYMLKPARRSFAQLPYTVQS